ncbi:MAG: hypothetical protein HYT80_07845 [Euryarchaeota archaeon]|nr:hypothetical protein [Euryarchaeota archaeon]
MVDVQANLEVFLAVGVLGIGVLLGAIALLSYLRLRNPRALLIATGLAVFAVKGAYLVFASLESRGTEPWIVPVAAFDLGILAFLYLALRTR